MALHIGDTAPDFTSDTSTGKITFHEWIGKDWVFFFSHPIADVNDTQHTTVTFPIIPTSIDTAAAKVQFPQGWTEIRPYLRTTRV